MEPQITSVVHSAYFHLRQIAQLHLYLDTKSLTTLVYALLVLRIDYCNALYMGLPMRLLWKLQQVQSTAARLLSGVKKHQHISPTLYFLPVCFHASFKVTYKSLNGLGP